MAGRGLGKARTPLLVTKDGAATGGLGRAVGANELSGLFDRRRDFSSLERC